MVFFDWFKWSGVIYWLDQNPDYRELKYLNFYESIKKHVFEKPKRTIGKGSGVHMAVEVYNKILNEWLLRNPNKTKEDFDKILV